MKVAPDQGGPTGAAIPSGYVEVGLCARKKEEHYITDSTSDARGSREFCASVGLGVGAWSWSSFRAKQVWVYKGQLMGVIGDAGLIWQKLHYKI